MIGFYFKENCVRQDLQDHLDNGAYGLRVSRRKAKKIFTQLNFEEQHSVFSQGQ